jgi:hypothetical protein
MMTEDEFWAALVPVKPVNILYRIYYNEQGDPLFFSQEDLPGLYLDISHELYINPPKHFKIINNSIVLLDTAVVKKLYPTKSGTPCHPQDVSVIVKDTEPNIKWSLR